MSRSFNTRYPNGSPKPRITIELLDGSVYPAAMFRESPTVPRGIEIMCNAEQRWLLVREQKAEFDSIVIHGGTFHEAVPHV